jgi:predicted RNase H-like nuclease
MHFVGVDACRAGWVAVGLTETGDVSHMVAPTIAAIAERYRTALILVDVPIGLRDSERDERRCDLEARAVLGPRASSVFAAPCRSALRLSTYAEASAEHHRRTGRRLPKQSFAIAPRVLDVEEYLRRHSAEGPVVREFHPEVCFWGLAGRSMTHPKRTAQGAAERLAVLKKHFPEAKQVVDGVLSAYGKGTLLRDDAIDALVGAVTARIGVEDLQTLPERPEVDGRGLRMEMVYARRQTKRRSL